MDIRELLRTDLMIMDLKAQTKAEVIDEMVRNLFEKGVIKDEEAYKKDIIKREEEGSTGMGDGIAIPHAHNEAVNEPAVMFAKSQAGVDYDSLDGQPAHLFFMIAAPEGGDNTHLQALAALSQVLMNPDVTSALKSADTPERFRQSLLMRLQGRKPKTRLRKKLKSKRTTHLQAIVRTSLPSRPARTALRIRTWQKKTSRRLLKSSALTSRSKRTAQKASSTFFQIRKLRAQRASSLLPTRRSQWLASTASN